jgi:hypothetical protein
VGLQVRSSLAPEAASRKGGPLSRRPNWMVGTGEHSRRFYDPTSSCSNQWKGGNGHGCIDLDVGDYRRNTVRTNTMRGLDRGVEHTSQGLRAHSLRIPHDKSFPNPHTFSSLWILSPFLNTFCFIYHDIYHGAIASHLLKPPT